MRKPLGIVIVSIVMFVNGSQSTFAQQLNKEPGSKQVRFQFSNAPWRSVIEWLAESGDYALHVNDLPLGSFTYLDERYYTIDEAINRINMFLIPQRYTLVRSERLLSVISLIDESSVWQLDSMARTVDVAQLKTLGSHEFVKCLFPLGDTAPEHAIEELSSLLLMREPSVLQNTNQLLVMDTAAKLRTVDKVLGMLVQPSSASGPVKRFALGNLDSEKTLVQVRPHVGLDPLAMTGADVRLSIDKDRRQLLASGSNENLRAIASVIALLQEAEVPQIPGDELIFRTHDLADAEMQSVVNVLQTLLAEEVVRLAANPRSNQIAVHANERAHELVEKTIKELSGTHNSMEFKVFEVNAVDARYAAIVLNDMFASQLPPPDSEDVLPESPRIDADSVSGRIFVRARRSQLAEIESALLQLGRASSEGRANLRVLPYHGDKAKTLLDSVRRFWPYKDTIEVVPSPNANDESEPLEREIESRPQRKSTPPGQGVREGRVPLTRKETRRSHNRPNEFNSLFVATRTQDRAGSPIPGESQTQAAEGVARIRVQQTSVGLLVHSDDMEALARFEEHCRLLTGSRQNGDRRRAVFYLKHAKVDNANELLRQLLADESMSRDGNASALARLSLPPHVTDDVSDFDNVWTYETATIIPEKRLNRLFVYGSQADLDAIEGHLQVIDRENSIADLKTRGTPRIILLDHAHAEDVAALLRDTYSGRIASTAKERNAAAALSNQNQRGRAAGNQSRFESESNALPPANEAAAADEDKMTLAVDVQSNAVVVTAPSQLADQVETLARAIDEESKQVVQMLRLSAVQALRVRASLKGLFGDQVVTGEADLNANARGRSQGRR